MVNQFNCEENRFPVTSSPLKHLGTVLLLMRYQLNYEANRSIFTVVVFAVLYQSNYDANRDIFTLTSWHRFPPGNTLTIQLWSKLKHHHVTIVTVFSCLFSINWTMRKIPKSSPWHLGIVLTAMLYQLIYEGDGNIITLTLRHRSHQYLNILALFAG